MTTTITTKELCDCVSLEQKELIFKYGLNLVIRFRYAMCNALNISIQHYILSFPNIDRWDYRPMIRGCIVNNTPTTEQIYGVAFEYGGVVRGIIKQLYPTLSRKVVDEWLKDNGRDKNQSFAYWFDEHEDRVDFMNYYLANHIN